MNIKEIAERFSQLAKENKFGAIQDELYAEDAVSIEPPGGVVQGLTTAEGMEAIRKKGEAFNSMIEEMHGGFTTEPVIGGNYFSVGMGMGRNHERCRKNTTERNSSVRSERW